MRVLAIDQYSDLGGGQLCLLDLLPAFFDRGWQVHAAIPAAGPFAARLLSGGASVDFFQTYKYHQTHKSLGDMLRFPFDFCRQVRHFTNLVSCFRPDLIYVNGPRVLPAAALSAKRLPIIFHAHHLVCQNIVRGLVKSCVNRSNTAVLACSESVGRLYQRCASPGRLVVLPNGVVDHGYEERFHSPLSRPSPRIGIVGRITPCKGQLRFVECARLLTKRLPEARFLVCGTSNVEDAAYERGVFEMSRGLPLDWLGWRDGVAEILRQLDILMVPSEMEGLPRVMLEAFSAGVVVVAFPVGGIPGVIRHGDNGFLVEERSAGALAQTVENVLKSRNLLQTVARNARLDWERHYTLDRFRSGVMTFVDITAGV